jgi:hypothetical protein
MTTMPGRHQGIISKAFSLVPDLEDEFEAMPSDSQAVLGSQLELRCDSPQGKQISARFFGQRKRVRSEAGLS